LSTNNRTPENEGSLMQTDNRQMFETLIANSQIDFVRGPIFDTPPSPLPDLDFDRIEGMLLGIAIGDGLGNTSEGMLKLPERWISNLSGRTTDRDDGRVLELIRQALPSTSTGKTYG
jgi:hypothetical protein